MTFEKKRVGVFVLEIICGIIYFAICRISKEIYVGKSAYGLETRQGEHWRNSFGNRKLYTKFYNRIRDYGWDNLDWYLLEDNITTMEELSLLEEYWVDTCDSFLNGLNSVRGGGGTWGYKHRDDSRKKMSLAQQGEKGSSAILTDAQVTLIKPKLVAGISIREIAREYGVAPSTVQGIKKCRTWLHILPELNDQLIEIVALDRTKQAKKPVIQLDKVTKEFIAGYPSATEAGRETGIHPAHIGSCCMGKRTNAGKYKWLYAS